MTCRSGGIFDDILPVIFADITRNNTSLTIQGNNVFQANPKYSPVNSYTAGGTTITGDELSVPSNGTYRTHCAISMSVLPASSTSSNPTLRVRLRNGASETVHTKNMTRAISLTNFHTFQADFGIDMVIDASNERSFWLEIALSFSSNPTMLWTIDDVTGILSVIKTS